MSMFFLNPFLTTPFLAKQTPIFLMYLWLKECPFQCSGCMKGFRTLGLLKMHRERLMCGFTQQDLFKNIQDDTSAES